MNLFFGLRHQEILKPKIQEFFLRHFYAVDFVLAFFLMKKALSVVLTCDLISPTRKNKWNLPVASEDHCFVVGVSTGILQRCLFFFLKTSSWKPKGLSLQCECGEWLGGILREQKPLWTCLQIIESHAIFTVYEYVSETKVFVLCLCLWKSQMCYFSRMLNWTYTFHVV